MSSLTAKSNRCKEGRNGTAKLLTPDSHVDGEKGARTIVYNTKKDSKEGGRKKKKKQEKSEKLKKDNSKKKEFYTIDHIIRA